MSGCLPSWNLTSIFLVKQISMCNLHHRLTSLTETVSPCINELLLFIVEQGGKDSPASVLYSNRAGFCLNMDLDVPHIIAKSLAHANVTSHRRTNSLCPSAEQHSVCQHLCWIRP